MLRWIITAACLVGFAVCILGIFACALVGDVDDAEIARRENKIAALLLLGAVLSGGAAIWLWRL